MFSARAEIGCLTIYDKPRRYREIALLMNDNKTRVIDVSESIIEMREAADVALQGLANGTVERLILWLPWGTSRG